MAEKHVITYKRLNPQVKVKTQGTFMVDTTLVILETDASELLGITKRMIQKYKEQGLRHHPTSVKGAVVYDLVYLIRWYEYNIKKTVKASQQIVTNDGEDATKMLIDEVVLEIKRQKLSTDRLKYKELNGTLINSDDLSKSMAEQAVLHKTYYQDDLDLLPTTLAQRDETFINTFLTEHYKNRIENANSFISKIFTVKNIFHKKIMEFVNEP